MSLGIESETLAAKGGNLGELGSLPDRRHRINKKAARRPSPAWEKVMHRFPTLRG